MFCNGWIVHVEIMHNVKMCELQWTKSVFRLIFRMFTAVPLNLPAMLPAPSYPCPCKLFMLNPNSDNVVVILFLPMLPDVPVSRKINSINSSHICKFDFNAHIHAHMEGHAHMDGHTHTDTNTHTHTQSLACMCRHSQCHNIGKGCFQATWNPLLRPWLLLELNKWVLCGWTYGTKVCKLLASQLYDQCLDQYA